jgi:hypothetical protein
MSVDELKAGFARLAEPVVPAEDPYGRLLHRARRSRRTRLMGWGSTIAAGLVAALLVPLLAQATGGGPNALPGIDDNRGVEITGWVQRLLDTPTRGSLAADDAFNSGLTSRLRPRFFGFSPELSQQSVLFAADAGSYRVVLVAFHSDTRQMGVWLVGDARTSAVQLADGAAGNASRAATRTATNRMPEVLVDELRPFAATGVADPASNRYLAVGLAPGGCQVATRDQTGPGTWQAAPTGDYVVRTDPLVVAPSTLTRVTCDGVERYRAPILNNARVDLAARRPTEAQIDAALTGARGTPPARALVRQSLQDMQESAASFDSCKVLYSGPVPGSVDSSPIPGGVVREPPVLVTACTTRHGNTAVNVLAESGGGTGGYTRVKLTDPHAIFAVRGLRVQDLLSSVGGDVGHDTSSMGDERVLVLAPPTASQLQVLKAGLVSQSFPLTGGVGGFVLSMSETVQLRALDRSGSLVGSGTAPVGEDIPEERPGQPGDVFENWS